MIVRLRPIVLFVLVASCFAFAVPASAADDETPEAVTRRYFDAIRTGGVTAAVEFMHPDALADFKQLLVPLFDAEEAAGRSDLRRTIFGPDTTLEQVSAMTPAGFMGGFAGVMDRQVGQIEFTELDVLGSVPEGDDTRHVLARIGVDVPDSAGEVDGLEVVTLIRWKETWRLGMTEQMKGLADSLRRQLLKPSPDPKPGP